MSIEYKNINSNIFLGDLMKKIKIIAPSSYVPGLKWEQLEKVSDLFKKFEYNFNYGKYLFEKKYFLAGSDSERLADLMNAFLDKKTDVIMVLRGGAGSLHLLDKIDYKVLSKNKKPFFGFSDSTALQNAFYKKAELPSFSGFWLRDAFDGLSALTKKTLVRCLKNEPQTYKVPFLSEGKASGILLGGNMRGFVSLLGTPYFPDMTDKILILEEVGEAPYQLDNMFMQLRLAGVFDKIKGLILGDFSRVGTPKDEKMLNDMIKEYFSDMPYPVARFKKYSHEKDHVVIPFGGMVHLDSKKRIISLDKLKKIK